MYKNNKTIAMHEILKIIQKIRNRFLAGSSVDSDSFKVYFRRLSQI